MGIVQREIATLPREFVYQGDVYTFVLEHDPLEHNYQHCEIRIYRNGNRLTKNELKKAKAAKLYYRHEMASRATLLLLPEVAQTES